MGYFWVRGVPLPPSCHSNPYLSGRALRTSAVTLCRLASGYVGASATVSSRPMGTLGRSSTGPAAAQPSHAEWSATPSERSHVSQGAHQPHPTAATPRPCSTSRPVPHCHPQPPPPPRCGKVRRAFPVGGCGYQPGRNATEPMGQRIHSCLHTHARRHIHTHTLPIQRTKKQRTRRKKARSGCQTRIREDHRRSHTREKSRRGPIAKKKEQMGSG